MRNESLQIIKRAMPVGLSLLLLLAAIIATVVSPTAMTTLRNLAFDTYQRLSPREYQTVSVRIIDIDDASLERVGQWPWPRTILADLVARLTTGGATAIGLDILFAEPDRASPREALAPWLADPAVQALVDGLPDYDAVLARAVAESPVVTGFVLTNDAGDSPPPIGRGSVVLAGDSPLEFIPGFSGSTSSLNELQEAATGNGALNMVPGTDGVIRTLQLLFRQGETIYPSLAAEALRVSQGADNYVVKSSGASGESRFGARTGVVNVRIGSLPVATDASGAIWLHYSEPVAARTIPAWRVLAGDVEPQQLADSIVFVGTSAAGLKDLRLNALGQVTAGAEVHAQAVEQILQQSYLTRPDWATAAEVLFMIVIWLVLVTLILRFGPLPAAIIGLTATAAAYLGSWLAFDRLRLLLDPTFPSLTAFSVYFVCSLSRHLQAERDKRWIRRAFSSYISPNLVRHLIENPSELGLGGERRVCSFVMSDLEAFTSLVEQSEPAEVVGLLNEYLDGIVAIALEHEGTIDRIVGDAVAVMFSAPAPQPDHAARAVACALAIDAFARRFRSAKQVAGIAVGRTRIGVNTGLVIIGNVGGERIVDYRALGDAVNVTARLEAINQQLGTTICVSGSTAAACPSFLGRPVGTLVLKGKTKGVETFEPISPSMVGTAAAKAYEKAFALLASGDPTAGAAFSALHNQDPEDALVAFHWHRLEAGEAGATVRFTTK